MKELMLYVFSRTEITGNSGGSHGFSIVLAQEGDLEGAKELALSADSGLLRNMLTGFMESPHQGVYTGLTLDQAFETFYPNCFVQRLDGQQAVLFAASSVKSGGMRYVGG